MKVKTLLGFIVQTTVDKKHRKIGPYILIKPIGKGSYSTVY